MKFLDGAELADFIKQRQIGQVRGLRQAHGVAPCLAIVVTKDDPVIETYTRLKRKYVEDILVDVDIHKIEQEKVSETIEMLNNDTHVHGIIVQLPLSDTSQTEQILHLIDPKKDVDGLGKKAIFDPATPQAIDWLLAGYNVDIKTKKICIVGSGRLVGEPLATMWQQRGYDITVVTENDDLETSLKYADIIVTATGQPRIIKNGMIAIGAVVIDAGASSESGEIIGDVDDEVYMRDDLTITPKKGGVGPLTVAVLFENVIRSARLSPEQQPDAV